MNQEQEDSYGHRTDTMDIPEPEYETVSGAVYLNEDPGSRPTPVADEIYVSSGEEHIGDYPEGSYQTWSPRQQEEFGVEDSIDAVRHFFNGAIEVPTDPEEHSIEDNVGYHTKDGSGW